jgi:hypothetical protein
MANEAVCYERPIKFARYTVADGIAIPKGTILKLESANKATACSADNDPVAGIAMMEKVASDGSTEISAALDGTWGLHYSSAAITVGNDVVVTAANTVGVYTTLDREKGYVVGKALETVSTSGSGTIKVRVNV